MPADYDSTQDTLDHIEWVQHFMGIVINVFLKRSYLHDQSKLQEPEKALFDKFTPLLKSVEYNSQEYKAYLKEMGAALEHHYAVNNHHPEHYPGGINDMSLFDILEMFCDWYAASKRVSNGSMEKSITINRERFGMSDQLYRIFMNTYHEINLHDF